MATPSGHRKSIIKGINSPRRSLRLSLKERRYYP
jgi:hypothetical protein